ncbi:hypothetical protein DYB28_013895 [Aphanomyces astaci]|uniref:Uncharacterized protein n=1 Tax=Aphanomyces astaci TaxID=112090 RepID=A0A397AIA1_APHAT|nr:hypothetical protein DYB25_000284 [Aphanomyces astaci]RHY20689.1 hypothetical protein DYB36_003139 [Aphanomyces astaci]RHY39697.1 hypothetical protein DYB38_010564 [Aphanomyces astaci]RHY50692.1 hypothetical protein DYB30_010684 [Aphanomyces astaci]RHY51712.1 hypothetical protein DYB34_004930 [Aphanomyces astaci]
MKTISAFAFASLATFVTASDNSGFDSNARAPSTHTFRSALDDSTRSSSRSRAYHHHRTGRAAALLDDTVASVETGDHRLRWALFSDADGLVATGDDNRVVLDLLAKSNALNRVVLPPSFSFMAEDAQGSRSNDEASVLFERHEALEDEDETLLDDRRKRGTAPKRRKKLAMLLALRDALNDAVEGEGNVPSPPRFLRDNY